MQHTIDFTEVSKHTSAKDCWVVLYGKVYDVSNFLDQHPGGSAAILRLAGTDATEEYDPVHPPGTLEDNLSVVKLIGPVEISTIPTHPANVSSSSHEPSNLPHTASDLSTSEQSQAQSLSSRAIIPTSLEGCLSIEDIEAFATTRLSNKAWAYYYSAGDDLISKSFNNTVYQSILLRPRVFVDCTICVLSTQLLLHAQQPLKLDTPIFVSPAAQARLAHPDGEAGIARACAKFGALQIISNNASLTPEQIVAAAPDGKFGFQLYIQETRSKSAAALARIAKLPQIKFVCLTLDAPVPGKREHDERRNTPLTDAASTQPTASIDLAADPAARAATATGGVGKALFAGTATDLTWRTTLPWLVQHTQLPLVLKGIQTHEDALLASNHPQVRGILLSNHGGRACDTAPPAVHTLLEIRRHCPEVFHKLDVWVDGGIKRGTDVVKALCLGAKAVGIGRAALYGLGAAGQPGVEKVLGILTAETETCVRLLGVEHIQDLSLRHINTRAVERDIYLEPSAPLRANL